MRKRGQITIFIIVGILILAITAASLYFSSKIKTLEQDKLLKIEELKGPVKSQVNYCLEKSVKDGIFYTGMQGGYYFTPPVSEHYLGAFIPYYFYDGENHVPDIGVLEEQLAKTTNYFLPACLNEMLALFEEEGMEISYEIKEVKVRVTDTKVIVEASLPIKIRYKGVPEGEETGEEVLNLERLTDRISYTELMNFAADIDFKYKQIYDWSKEIVQLQAREPNWFPLSGISDLAFEEGFTYEIIGVDTVYGEGEEVEGFEEAEFKAGDDRNKVLISLVDRELFDRPYYFTFGILYNVNYEEMFAEDIALEEEIENGAELAATE